MGLIEVPFISPQSTINQINNLKSTIRMQLGFVSAILPELNLKQVLNLAQRNWLRLCGSYVLATGKS